MNQKLRWLVSFSLLFPTLLFAQTPGAHDISGKYYCEGYDAFHDIKYSGDLEIMKVGTDYQFQWDFGKEGGRYSGTALYSEKNSAIGVMFDSPDENKETGVGIYKIMPNGNLAGTWMYDNRDVISNEMCTPQG